MPWAQPRNAAEPNAHTMSSWASAAAAGDALASPCTVAPSAPPVAAVAVTSAPTRMDRNRSRTCT